MIRVFPRTFISLSISLSFFLFSSFDIFSRIFFSRWFRRPLSDACNIMADEIVRKVACLPSCWWNAKWMLEKKGGKSLYIEIGLRHRGTGITHTRISRCVYVHMETKRVIPITNAQIMNRNNKNRNRRMKWKHSEFYRLPHIFFSW